MQTPAVWGNDTLWKNDTSYNHRFFRVDWSTMVKLYQAPDQVDSTGFRRSAQRYVTPKQTVSVAITALPAYLAHAKAVYLLAGKSGDDLTRLLVLPRGGSPEVKYLRVTLNQILDELATRSAKANESLIEEDASDIESEEAWVTTDEDELDSELDESSATRSEVHAMSADDDSPEIWDSEESSDRRSEVAEMSADDDRQPGIAQS